MDMDSLSQVPGTACTKFEIDFVETACAKIQIGLSEIRVWLAEKSRFMVAEKGIAGMSRDAFATVAS